MASKLCDVLICCYQLALQLGKGGLVSISVKFRPKARRYAKAVEPLKHFHIYAKSNTKRIQRYKEDQTTICLIDATEFSI